MDDTEETFWVCLVCGRAKPNRDELKDISCFIRARQFRLAGITFSDALPGFASDVDAAYLVQDESDESHGPN